jgi:hypothetical protein
MALTFMQDNSLIMNMKETILFDSQSFWTTHFPDTALTTDSAHSIIRTFFNILYNQFKPHPRQKTSYCIKNFIS